MARMCVGALSVGLLICLSSNALAQDHPRWRVDAGLAFSHFEQQIKVEIGGARGEKLVTDSELGLNVFATYNPLAYLGVGMFAQANIGRRDAARFERIGADNKTVTTGEVGGGYQELWVGPLLRGQYKTLFAEVGYGFGARDDDARDDVPSRSGQTETVLYTSPTVSWLFAVGAGVPLTPSLQAVLRVEYRVRYYNRRSDGLLADNLVHGTQNLLPFVGLGWTF